MYQCYSENSEGIYSLLRDKHLLRFYDFDVRLLRAAKLSETVVTRMILVGEDKRRGKAKTRCKEFEKDQLASK